MTRQSVFSEGTPFSEWLRRLARPLDSSVFSNQNLDYIWHNYRQNWMILVEEKRFNGGQSFAQKDTHSIVDQALRFACEHKCTVKNARGNIVPFDYRGYFLIQFEQTTPDDSKHIAINGRLCTKQDLLNLLSTGRLNLDPGVPAFLAMRANGRSVP